MATLTKLAASDVLTAIDVAIDGKEQPWRNLYAYGRFLPWLSKHLPTMCTQAIGGDSTPEEQVYDLLNQYVIGAPLILDRMFKPLHPHPHGIWELKTIDIRIFGWFPAKDNFIAVVADDKSRIKDHGLYAGYVGEVIFARDKLDLDPPKFVPGGMPDDVISVCPQSA